ncbi:MAG: hypothetical protein LBD87_04495, partial [Prevotellaceae bacterium]|nr:hypothetical protein [Prevotellaceae bacterium]
TNPGSTVTATLSNAPAGKFNWCVYGSDYPPNAVMNGNSYTLKGTPPFKLIASNGTTTQTINGKTIAIAAITVTPATITDATGYPGLWCPYTGSDLYMDASHLCRQRTSGARNWEAYIRDSRDREIYRIVLMPDGKWWLAQNVKYAGTGYTISFSGCTPEICGRHYDSEQFNKAYGGTSGWGANKQGVCPNQWVLPIKSDWNTLFTSISTTASVVCERLRSATCTCTPRTDYYGWANKMRVGYGNYAQVNCHWWENTTQHCFVRIDHISNTGNVCSTYEMPCLTDQSYRIAVRCFRQL